MNSGAIFWMILLVISALLFFGVAIVVAIRGARELKELLKGTETSPTARS
jgi:hypothetical protein